MILSKKDLLTILFLFVLALGVRLFFISRPDSVVFDEGVYGRYVQLTSKGEGYFDIHPTFGNQLFTALVSSNAVPQKNLHDAATPFDDFPHLNIRIFNAIIGALLVVIIYCIGKMLFPVTISPFLPAFFVAIDNALVIYSRLMLPDTLLLFCGMLGFAFVCAVKDQENKKYIFTALTFAGIFLGLAASVKWTGLGFFAAACVALLVSKKLKHAFYILLVLLITYSAVFVNFYMHSKEGSIVASNPKYQVIKNVTFPDHKDFFATLTFLPRYTQLMYQLNYDPQLVPVNHVSVSPPQQWPFAGKQIILSLLEDKIFRLTPNLVTWLAALFALIAAFTVYLYSFFTKSKTIHPSLTIIILAFAANYAPFFLIGRSLFLYHYFAALIFSYLLVPFVVSWLEEVLVKNKFKLPRNSITVALCVLSVIAFAAFMPMAYGF